MSLDTYKATQALLEKIDMNGELVKMPGAACYDEKVIVPNKDGLVTVTPMVTSDEQIFLSPTALTSGEGVRKVLMKRVAGMVNPDALYDPDVEFLLAAIRTVTFTPFYDTRVKCVKCGEIFDSKVNVEDIPCLHYGPEDIESSITLSNGQTVKDRFLTFSESLKINDDDSTAVDLARIVSVDGIEDKVAIEKWYLNLRLNLKKEVYAHLDRPLGGFEKNNVHVKCSECGADNITSIDILRDFFVGILA